ncbi:MAG TPA: glycoside hydrolase family 19 protein [Methyloradius sp.]
MITVDALKKAFPLCAAPEDWVKALAPAMEQYAINTPARIASFLAQTGHESSQFNRLVECLIYKTALRLTKVWPKRFPDEASALPYVNNEEKLANLVYAKRLGNGDTNSGDGYRFRGRGIIQITGRSNYADAGKALGLDLVNQPDLLLQKPNAALSAAWFWNSRGLNALADDRTDDNDLEDFTEITKRINGGSVGLNERLALLNIIESQLA